MATTHSFLWEPSFEQCQGDQYAALPFHDLSVEWPCTITTPQLATHDSSIITMATHDSSIMQWKYMCMLSDNLVSHPYRISYITINNNGSLLIHSVISCDVPLIMSSDNTTPAVCAHSSKSASNERWLKPSAGNGRRLRPSTLALSLPGWDLSQTMSNTSQRGITAVYDQKSWIEVKPYL